ncbi:MAG: transposase [Methylomarinum sp.]|nr:transposase [Methylomarinum sp.]
MQYRRANIKGGTYFFTVNLAERNKALLTDNIDILRNVLNQVKKQHPFQLDAMVVLPEHLHALLTLPLDDHDYSTRWALIKANFSRQIPKNERINKSRKSKGERGIWQRRFWEHLIRDELDYENHVNYIHYNPVKHNYVDHAVDWPYSTIHRYISEEILKPDWGGKYECTAEIECGERS